MLVVVNSVVSNDGELGSHSHWEVGRRLLLLLGLCDDTDTRSW